MTNWPSWMQHFVCKNWNYFACIFLGHRWLCRRAPGELPVCADCNRKIKRFKENEVMNEW